MQLNAIVPFYGATLYACADIPVFACENQNAICNKAIVDSILRPCCAPPSPFPADNAFFSGEENPFPAIGDAAYREHVRDGPSHGHRQYTQKFGKDRACGSGYTCIVNGEENHFPAIRYAAYRQRAGGRPSHGHKQHAKNAKDRACGSGDIHADRQTDTQTDRHTHHHTS